MSYGGRNHSKSYRVDEIVDIMSKTGNILSPSNNGMWCRCNGGKVEPEYMMGVDFAKQGCDATSVSMFKKLDGGVLEQIHLSKLSDDIEFNNWQEYLLKLACSTFNIGPSIINKVTEQKSKNMNSVAIRVTSNDEFRNVEQYLLIGGAYWNGKTKHVVYNDGRTLHFYSGKNSIYPKHYFVTLSKDDLQMNMFPGTPTSEQGIRRSGYNMISVEQFKSTVTISNEAKLFFSTHPLFSKGAGMQVDLYPLFDRSNFKPDDYRKNIVGESSKSITTTLPYINMFEVGDIVNTTTKTTVTKLLATLGGQNTKKSSGICLSNKSIKSITK